MSKFKPVRKGGKTETPKPGAVPCAILIISGIALLSLLFYAALSSSVK
ncbi:MAG: hypothetical protein JST93_28350 [Acidobacteria bacterium]|nr:hypothetical protein [Acidobacteriota bacterium]